MTRGPARSWGPTANITLWSASRLRSLPPCSSPTSAGAVRSSAENGRAQKACPLPKASYGFLPGSRGSGETVPPIPHYLKSLEMMPPVDVVTGLLQTPYDVRRVSGGHLENQGAVGAGYLSRRGEDAEYVHLLVLDDTRYLGQVPGLVCLDRDPAMTGLTHPDDRHQGPHNVRGGNDPHQPIILHDRYMPYPPLPAETQTLERTRLGLQRQDLLLHPVSH